MTTIAHIELYPVNVPYRKAFTLGNGVTSDASGPGKPVLFVRMETDDGLVGWGEQRAEPRWSYETIETMAAAIRYHLAPLAIGLSPFDVALFHERADAALSVSVSNGMPFARAAMDMAFHDLAGKLAGVPLHAFLGGALASEVALCSAIGVSSPEAMAAQAQESSAYSAYKIKVAGDVPEDSERIRAIAGVTAGKPLWLDANQSYTPGTMVRLLRSIADVEQVVCVEQPVKSTDWSGMAAIRQRSPLPLALDEGCFSASDLAKAVRFSAADMVVLKICKSGGIRKCLETAAVAKANGLELLGSGLTDCGVAFAASVHLFSTLKLALPAELNGPELLQDMLVQGLDIRDGVVRVPSAPGLGVEPEVEKLLDLRINV
ncbi:enolase C-terminal domain-like protein [Paenibacillus oryzisoli]|uniref:mandelate racemase/muconate lactonizing enzyme family protein n=1 Tax=Paenibacillus oryzisoli TaxID=1850517 RepID=UPI003D275981